MDFHVGQQVVCVDADSGKGKWPRTGKIEKGTIYTVRELGVTVQSTPGLRLFEKELTNNPGSVGAFSKRPFKDAFYKASRFRPVKDTDISIFTAMLKPPQKEKV